GVPSRVSSACSILARRERRPRLEEEMGGPRRGPLRIWGRDSAYRGGPMKVGNKYLVALAMVALLALLAVFGPSNFGAPAEATHGGMDTMSIDMDTSGNSAASLGALQQCARINRNGVMDADEDVTDGVIIDITAGDIPA